MIEHALKKIQFGPDWIIVESGCLCGFRYYPSYPSFLAIMISLPDFSLNSAPAQFSYIVTRVRPALSSRAMISVGLYNRRKNGVSLLFPFRRIIRALYRRPLRGSKRFRSGDPCFSPVRRREGAFGGIHHGLVYPGREGPRILTMLQYFSLPAGFLHP